MLKFFFSIICLFGVAFCDIDTTVVEFEEKKYSDTITSVLGVDSLNLLGVAIDTALFSDSNIVVETQIADSILPPLWTKKAINIALGWVIGNIKPFEIWSNANPLSISKTGLTSEELRNCKFVKVDMPPDYTTLFPISVSFSSNGYNKYRSSVILRYSGIYRKYNAAVYNDSLEKSVWSLKRKLSLNLLEVGLSVSRTIGSSRFSVDNTDDVAIVCALYGIPIIRLNGYNNLSNIKKDYFTVYGYGISWEAGICTFKKVTSNSGVKTTLAYTGSWNGNFHYDNPFTDKLFFNNTLIMNVSTENQKLQYISHRFIISVELIVGTKKNDKSIGEKL